jgi:hypothetical protein
LPGRQPDLFDGKELVVVEDVAMNQGACLARSGIESIVTEVLEPRSRGPCFRGARASTGLQPDPTTGARNQDSSRKRRECGRGTSRLPREDSSDSATMGRARVGPREKSASEKQTIGEQCGCGSGSGCWGNGS